MRQLNTGRNTQDEFLPYRRVRLEVPVKGQTTGVPLGVRRQRAAMRPAGRT